MTERQARQQLRATGEVRYNGFLIWIPKDDRGQYTNQYRMCPWEKRWDHTDYVQYTETLKSIFAYLNAL